jgi:nicotinamidase-related amidase
VPKTALVVVDVIQTYEFEDGDKLAANFEKARPRIRELLERAREAEVPILHVNDSGGEWSANRQRLVEEARATEYGHLLDGIEPRDDGIFVLKARHSIFYQTPMDDILWEHEIEHLVLTGQVTEQCILYSALDGHLRHRPMTIVRDAVAHIHDNLAEAALEMMETNMHAEVCPAEAVRF